MTPQVRGRMLRTKMACDWATVHAMLTGKAPRKDAQGRNVWEVWADCVLANPPAEYARVIREILPQEQPEGAVPAGAMITNIQALYLTALQAANVRSGGEISDTTSHKQIEGVADTTQGANGVQPPVSDW
jgi:hypothetical protein